MTGKWGSPWRLIGCLAGAGALCLTACTPGPAADRDGVQVVAAFYPLAFVAERVVGERGSVTDLTGPRVEPHDLELTPQQLVSVAEADLVIYETGFQPAVDEAVEQNAEGAVLDVRRALSAQGGSPIAGGGPARLGAFRLLPGDPHFWLDPTGLAIVARATAERLAQLAPAGAAGFHARADALVTGLHRLDAEFRRGLAHCRRDVVVTNHAAFGYLTRRYGLRMVAVSAVDPHAEPSPERLREVAEIARHERVTTVFGETLADRAASRALAGELGLRTDILDPLEGLTPASRGGDYLEVMRANLTALRTANGCR